MEAPLAGRLRLALYGLLPPLVCLAVFYPGLFAWFQQDDFPWLRLKIDSWSDFWRVLVEPRPHGTIRPLSERLFFLVFRRLFDLDAFPYRVFVFLTQLGNLAMLASLARRLTGSRLAAAVAALVWGLNVALLTPMVWTLAYNQILCSFFFLASLLLFLRHVETGLWRFYALQCVTFLLGFGALETIVAYPAVVLLFCLLRARPHAWKALPLAIPSALYLALHLWVIPHSVSGPYAIHLDLGILRALANYWTWALGPVRFSQVVPIGQPAALAIVLIMTIALLGALARSAPEARRNGLFGLAWFLLTLAPVLPLRDQISDYYMTIPAIGLALAVASALPIPHPPPTTHHPPPTTHHPPSATHHPPSPIPHLAAAVWLAVYFVCSVSFLRHAMPVMIERSHVARRFVDGVRQIRAQHPGKTILLTGVTYYLFYAAVYDEGPRTAGITDVYLAPTNVGIASKPGLLPIEQYQLPPRATLTALRNSDAVVYEITPAGFRNITTRYAAVAPALLRPTPPRRVVVGEARMAEQLGPGWYGISDNHRWMGRRAELRLAGPRSAQERLRIDALRPEQPGSGPVTLSVSVNGVPVGRALIRDNRRRGHTFALPAAVVGLDEITVTLETDRTYKFPPDQRDLGLVFGIVELVDPDGR